MPSSHVDRLRKAVQEHLAGRCDGEGRSPLDLLVVEVMADSPAQSIWSSALNSLISRTREQNGAWWQAIEFFVAMAKLCTRDLADNLEQVIVRSDVPDAIGRASIYALLAECGRPVTAKTVWEDVELRREAPLLWLDLLLLLIPEPEKRQEVVLDAVRRREFGVSDFEIRLDDMRSIGGQNLGRWLWVLRESLPHNQRHQYDAIITEAGFTISSGVTTSPVRLRPRMNIELTEYRKKIKKNPQTYPQYGYAQ